jgi:hypothetical protein
VIVSDGPLPDLLYHFTDSAELQGILESRTLWATDIRYLNDETEVKYSRDLEERSRVRTFRGIETPYEEIALTDEANGETPIVEIVIGPINRSDGDLGEVRTFLDRNGLEYVSVRRSLGPLRHSGVLLKIRRVLVACHLT